MALVGVNQVMVVAAYLDDEVLGSGGRIFRYANAVDQVQVLIGSEWATSRQQQRDRIRARQDLSALAQAAQTAGAVCLVSQLL